MDPVDPPSSAMSFGWDLGIVAIGRQLLTKKLESNSSDHHNTIFDTRYPGTPSLQQLPSTGTTLPLGIIPEDSSINMLSYLTATELCAVRRTSRQFLETADRQAEDLWGRLCYRDFPSMARQGTQAGLPSQQQYIRYVMLRAEEEVCNLRSTRDVRKSLEAYTCRGGTGVVGMASDIASLPDPLISRAVSRKRRAALWSVVVTDERVIQEFRRRGLHRGPLNFLPIRTLQHGHIALLTAAAGGGVAAGGGGREMLLPMAPETPAPAGFLGYVVRLLRLRSEHEHLRWTFFYAIFKDLMVFESAELAEALRARTPGGHLFYCSLDHAGTDSEWAVMDGDQPLPHIGHWGFRPLHGVGGNSTNDDGNEEDLSGAWGRGGGEAVADAVERLERTARYAKISLAFVRWR